MFYSLSSQNLSSDNITSALSPEALNSIADKCSGFLIIDEESLSTEQQISIIRQHPNPSVYLRPLIHLATDSDSRRSINVDESMLIEDFTVQTELALRNQFSGINRWIEGIPNNDNTLEDSSLRFRTLRMIASRNKTCKPTPTIHYKGGYHYGLVDPLFNDLDGSVEQVLEFLTSQQLLKPTFLKKAHFCPHCDSAFLNFKETCPDCHSDNIESDELVHHFKCGHTDTIANFTSMNQLKCPKCEDQLKHIGVDYDKPSTISTCLSCKLSFQDPQVKADCYACQRTSEADDLILRKINAYSISALGENAARYGLDALFTNILQTDLKLYSLIEIKQFITVERARIERYKKSQTSLAFIHFTNLDVLFSNLGRRTEQVFKEISAIFRAIFRESDLITARNESFFAVVMTETSSDNAQLAIDRLLSAIASLFENNLEFDMTMSTKIYDLMVVTDFEQVIDQFLSGQE